MKQLLFGFLFSFLLGDLIAQVPQAFSYQAVARDAAGICIQNSTISLRIGIRDTAANGPVIYLERHDNIATNAQGLFSLTIGTGVPQGTPDFTTLDWSNGHKWIEVEMDPQNGPNFVLLGTQQLMSVPYALQSQASQHLAPDIPGSLTVSANGTTITATLVDHWTFDQNGHSYALYSLSAATNWIVANDFCRKAKGHMITITSGAENQFVFSNMLSLSEAQGNIPIGLTDALGENRFDWITGEIGFDQAAVGRKVFRNWAPGQPDNSQGLEHYCEIRASSITSQRLWNDRQGGTNDFNAIIVEYDNGHVSP